jgi:cytochrome c2
MMHTRTHHAIVLAGILLGACTQDPIPDRPRLDGNAGRGLLAVRAFDCGACHEIPGLREARGRTGPSLEAFSRRIYLAGRLPNQPDALIAFLRDPPAHAPQTLMPAQGIDDATARDIAAYLYTLR